MNASTLKVILTLALALLLALSANAETVERRLEAAPDGLVRIDNTAGSIEVQGWPRNEVEVTGELGPGVEELVFERSDNTVVIRVEGQDRNGRDNASRITVRLPQNSSVDASGVSADVEIREVRGELRLASVSGNIANDVFDADVDVETVSGDVGVEGRGRNANARVSSVSGDIDIKNVSGAVEANSVSGDIVVSGGSQERVSARTTSGDIDYRGTLVDSGRMDIETINGDLDLEFLGDLSANFDVETFNGDISNCFGPKPSRTSRYAPGQELKFTESGGAGRVTVRTLNGDLRLCRD